MWITMLTRSFGSLVCYFFIKRWLIIMPFRGTLVPGTITLCYGNFERLESPLLSRTRLRNPPVAACSTFFLVIPGWWKRTRPVLASSQSRPWSFPVNNTLLFSFIHLKYLNQKMKLALLGSLAGLAVVAANPEPYQHEEYPEEVIPEWVLYNYKI